MDYNFIAIPTGCDSCYFIKRDLSFDAVGEKRVGGGNIDDVFTGD